MNTTTIKEIISNSEAETEQFAYSLAQTLPRGSVVALNGDLGAGKTVFSRGFARGLNITEPVSSPTYTIIQEYPCPDGGYFFHMDLYRINDVRAALDFGIDEYLNDPESWSVIEWPNRISTILPPHTINIKIENIDDDSRKITITNIQSSS
ncbi:MAG: tRNA (adenosine(37)-N6)-threonylcarbamoyltransferase complex ATPase subunit type 1 TsaE [Victivallaceae bacterium]|nr:tRNA (adenosine(37)-N6)-threonylcarbamoyltransferase complex ATPase subunit type 1 TsaE [Victivallaceae bacterium]MDD4180191.1 tRNA (adenosine(37)-N6)-threonylcarbamoyltransferase complex ATPase subunit type 1 TsaE [Victivallaceae bacterium]